MSRRLRWNDFGDARSAFISFMSLAALHQGLIRAGSEVAHNRGKVEGAVVCAVGVRDRRGQWWWS